MIFQPTQTHKIVCTTFYNGRWQIGLALIAIERQFPNEVDYNEVIDNFARDEAYTRRQL